MGVGYANVSLRPLLIVSNTNQKEEKECVHVIFILGEVSFSRIKGRWTDCAIDTPQGGISPRAAPAPSLYPPKLQDQLEGKKQTKVQGGKKQHTSKERNLIKM